MNCAILAQTLSAPSNPRLAVCRYVHDSYISNQVSEFSVVARSDLTLMVAKHGVMMPYKDALHM
jgi:hypothetical protein